MGLRGAEIYYCPVCGWFRAVDEFKGLCDACGSPLLEFRCSRCGHSWRGRSSKIPKVCPACKSQYWNRARDPAATMRISRIRYFDYIGDEDED